ncbi:putative 2-dehydropantoate 2-reductase [Dysgonomonas sp. 520]|uniref:putative 2-dehydropantoate 2-reductase n=1 Tax=Dysgonomonas sp. 520 TaxID=2302931 RepID=UPI0013D271BD|nr:putative 2-dehydropantoate 2-reductase [Dysgonomonas sp. 520]NDW10242.1 putative 2-dehydropantoate 2-reductase [Dysgonomonas sp. 520]
MALRYAVIGSGAIGGYYGGMLAKSGKDVHFLFHSDYEHVEKNGLQVDSVNGNFLISPIQAYHNANDMPQCDVVLVCLKSTNNAILKDLLPPLLHANTIVVLIQNGLGLEADLAKDFPNLSIAGAMAFICSNKIGDGHIAHLDQGSISIGSYSCKDSSILDTICSDFVESGVKCHIVDLEPARWKKLVWNIPYNGMTVVLNTTTDKLMKNPHTRKLLRDLMLEVIQAANLVGNGRFLISEDFADQMLTTTDKMTPYSPSMKLDYDNHRPLEIEYIYSRPVLTAKEAGYEMSHTAMLEQQLRFIESQYS